MDFLIADTFTDSLALLTSEEQKSVKTSAFDLQLNPAHPEMSFHKLNMAKDRTFGSFRVCSDIQLIVHISLRNEANSWFINTDSSKEGVFLWHTYFPESSASNKSLKVVINAAAWGLLDSDTSHAFNKPKSGQIAVKVINHLGDEVMNVFRSD